MTAGEHAALVLRTFEAFQRRDDEALFANYAADIEWDMRGYTNWLDNSVYHGHDGIREFFRQWLEDFDGYEGEAVDPVEIGDRVVVTVVDRATGRRSGASIERVHAQVWSFRAGKVSRIQVLDGRAEALAAARSTAAPATEASGPPP